jgi:cytochrome c553
MRRVMTWATSLVAGALVLLLLPALSSAQTPPEVVAPPVGSTSQAQLAATPPASPAELAAGERLYRLGIRADGSALQAQRALVGGSVAGAAAACETCHRRSGMGMQEGRLLVPPVAGPILFRPGQSTRPLRTLATAGARRAASAAEQVHDAARHQARPAYDLTRLARALRDGVDPSDRALDPLMPRYALSDGEVAQLAAYLDRLDPQSAAGVDPGGPVHFASVITPDAPPERRATLVDTLTRWAASMRLRGHPVRLHLWLLGGAPDTWSAQLAQHQAEQPVYAVLSGAGRAEWGPVQAFCEARRLPCLLPLIDRLPDGAGEASFYSLYYSGGIDAEAQLAARYLQTLPESVPGVVPGVVPAVVPGQSARLAQVHAPGDTLGAAAAASLGAAWTGGPAPPVLVLDGAAPAVGDQLAAWQRDGTTRLALWLAPAELQRWVQRWPDGLPGIEQVLLSHQLSPPRELDLPPAWQCRVVWASLKSDPTRLRAGQAMVIGNWLARLGLAERPGSTQAEVYGATFFVGDALARMRQGWSPTWLMEQLEQSVNNRPAGAVYFSLSLGPGQRVAAKVGRMLAVPAPCTADAGLPWPDRLAPLSELIRADD